MNTIHFSDVLVARSKVERKDIKKNCDNYCHIWKQVS
jgi:hypothetical protein